MAELLRNSVLGVLSLLWSNRARERFCGPMLIAVQDLLRSESKPQVQLCDLRSKAEGALILNTLALESSGYLAWLTWRGWRHGLVGPGQCDAGAAEQENDTLLPKDVRT